MATQQLPRDVLFQPEWLNARADGKSAWRIALAPLQITRVCAIIIALVIAGIGPLRAQSFFPQRPDDPRAVDFTRAAFGAHGDGVGDDAEPLQQAINRVQETTRAGVVLLPQGRYRLGKTVYVWQGIRLIGYGRKRPVLVLGRDTPGFQEGTHRYMVHFADNRPQPGAPFVDASEFTFYSGMNNIDFELQEGNPAAVAVRFHVAQHSALTHMDFEVGSARAALEDIGNQASDIHVHGGQYGIITTRTSPAWQFLLMDSSFDGQQAASIRTAEAGLTLIRVRFANTPVALQIAPGKVEQLYGRDLRMENIRQAVFVPGNWRNSRSAVMLTNIACTQAPCFYSGVQPVLAPAQNYLVEQFSLGMEIGQDGREQGIHLRHRERALSQPAPNVASDIPALPPMDKWVNVRTLGVKGEPSVDDTAALQSALDQHAALFFPSGTYRVGRSLRLKPDTVLIGLNPGTTRITLTNDSVAFAGKGDPIGVLTAPPGGSNIISSISVGTGIRNTRATGVIWMAGSESMLDDVSFPMGGFGGGFVRGRQTNSVAGNRTSSGRASLVGTATGNSAASGVSPAARAGVVGRAQRFSDTQAGDIIVRDGGGGIFRGCWAHDTNAKVGLRIENTSARGRIYQMSVEHHMHIESQFYNARNWEIYALQTEEENPAGAQANAVDIQHSQDLLFANTYMYRVSRNVLPKDYAAIVRHSNRIAFQNVKVFSQTRLAFDNAVLEQASGVTVRSHVFSSFAVKRGMQAPDALPLPAVFAKGARLERLATGFSNASGLTVSDAGTVFFSDAANRRIYGWNETAKKAELVAEVPGQPQVLGFVPPSSLLAIANERAVYDLNVDSAALGGSTDAVRVDAVKETDEPVLATLLLLPVGLHNELSVMNDMMEHRGFVYRRGSNTAIISTVTNEHRGYFYAPGTKTAVLAGGTWRPNLQSSQLATFGLGAWHYLTSEDDGRTYIATLENYHYLSTRVFVERGGTAVVADRAGNVYLASGQVWIYNRTGREIGLLELPERPGSLAFGGPDKRTLFIAARSSLYSIRTQASGM